ncbi:hypothetical protein ABET51_12645 [Metabacillus fastidiosus]|nr:hypothetical protein [Metabacillus fastidiosus]MEC2078579.1 hypothetical protein [Metabacillus fastidiosus]MED4533816.1 hypothetical protein [Metabacillus fastidiosus]
MLKQKKLTLSDFINKDRFELNSYLAYLSQITESKTAVSKR